MLQQVIQDIKQKYAAEFAPANGLSKDQGEVYYDITVQHLTEELKGLVFSGKLKEIQGMITGGAGAEELRNHPVVHEMISSTAGKYYGLEWNEDQKKKLAENSLVFIFTELRAAFERSGKSKDVKGILEFAGIDAGIMGKLAGGLLGKFGKFF